LAGWPTVVATGLAMLPILALVAIILSTLVNSLAAFARPAELFGPDLISPFVRTEGVQYGMQGPVWGSLLVTFVAITLALPVSLAMALIASEMRVPLLSNALSAIVGALAGIPPVIYAFGAIFLVQSFMAPKFAADSISDIRLKAVLQGRPTFAPTELPLQFPNNSTLLGGVLLGLLIIPLMTPLIDDAMHAVPNELKQASLALGAGYWYTLLRVSLPWALPGIAAATTLGMLVALGEVVIPYFVIGGALNPIHVTSPLWDVFDRTPPLTSTGASLVGGVGGEGEGIRDQAIAVSYATALLLLAFAIGIMGFEQILQRRLRARLHP
jgi:ABC-type phosphate transport system permease subunit